MEMLHSLNNLAGKISPQSGTTTNTTSVKGGGNNNNNNNNSTNHNNNNNNHHHSHHPYHKNNTNVVSAAITAAVTAAARAASAGTPPQLSSGLNGINNNNNNPTPVPPPTNMQVDISSDDIIINGTHQTSNGHLSPELNMSSGMIGGADQPDPDAIKMFVGQIPRSMDEEKLRLMFEEYGKVHQINVLRDKVTSQSKGCCFVTYYTRKAALDAQNAMHNIKTLTGMHHPIQMKPADSENRNERKLFVGMLSKKCNENDVRGLFGPFGTIEECTVLRDTNGQSKGCAFVTYTSKQCAINAIKAMHHSQTMEGCSSPMVVKFADTQKEKDQKRLQQMQANLWNLGGVNLTPQYLASESQSCVTPSLQLLQQMQQQANGQSANLSALASMQQLMGMGGVTMQQLQAGVTSNAGLQTLAALQNSAGLGLSNSGSATTANDISAANLQGLATLANLSVANPGVNPMSMQNLVTLAAMSGGNGANLQAVSPTGSIAPPTSSGNSLSAVSPVTSMGLGALSGSTLSTMASNLNGLASTATNGGGLDAALSSAYSSIQQYAGFPGFSQSATTATGSTGGGSQSGKQTEGPEGANLFIYHLPQEFSDSDLAQTFIPFGSVLSAKVFIDKQTNLSKCFGFVSYDNPVSAQAAIQAMNGFQIGTKRLKVQLKRSKEASRPY